jgi:hypothetical protein
MKSMDYNLYLLLLICSNLVAVLQLLVAVKWPRIARLSFFILFTWACFTNWNTSRHTPGVYLEYAELTWSSWYKSFITGWFSQHIQLVVGWIAVLQGLIAVSMLLKGWIFKMGALGAILFLIAILPLGVGAGFPSTAIMAIALFILLKQNVTQLIWKPVLNPGT